MEIIRTTAPENLGSLAIRVADKRIEPLLFRYRARHYPHTLTDTEQRRWAAHCRDYFERNLEGYMLNLENLVHEHQADPKKMAILKSVYHYVEKLAC
ncbi:exonuclease I [Vibrio cholerae]|nr:exonuclease I [Vibrio cholerae]